MICTNINDYEDLLYNFDIIPTEDMCINEQINSLIRLFSLFFIVCLFLEIDKIVYFMNLFNILEMIDR